MLKLNLTWLNTEGTSGNLAAMSGSFLLCYWTLSYGKTATSIL